MTNLRNTQKSYLEHVLAGNNTLARQLVAETLDAGTPAIDLYHHVFFPTMVETGELWQKNEISVAKEHMITAMTQNIIASLYPQLFKDLVDREEERGNVLVACPGGELHELGIRMLADIWELEGWNVTYLGANIPAEFITERLHENNYDIIGLSCAISFNIRFVKETIEMARKNGFNGPVIVGGRAFNIDPSLKDYVGSDYYGKDFYEAVEALETISN